ncbi:penicillin acylase family protein [Brachybacterium sacelli]|uniref:Acyl-homoserine-lactone acylase n=1 Tax=Brachybacterium sacelli TaxID=173364 RepID=A0ABS4X6Z3_9MICO|nr:acyl-homoserine-lactone acylase [Brachybacterium sacelli]
MKITWDEYGMPTITADDDLGACRGFGYAQALTHATAILELYGIARGRAASMWGEEFVEGDVMHARFGLDAAVQTWWLAQEDQTLTRLEAFCDGFNEACAEDPARGGDRREALPITPRDVVAHTFALFFGFARFWDQELAFPAVGGPGLLGGGSSAWAVSAEKSSTHESLLLVNPHIPWVGPYRLFEARTMSPGRRCHGVTPIGFPWQSFAYTSHLGWTHTVNPLPQLWVYELEVSGDQYRFDSDLIPFTTQEHVVEVRGGDAVRVTERRSVHGPVTEAPDGTLVAIRVAGVLHEPVTTALEAWWQMSLAETVPALFSAQERRPLPMFNIIAADSTGSVGAAFCGATPRRPGGAFDDSRRRLPGDDPAQIWERLNPPSSLPKVIDPQCGWVQNVNETPWWFCDPPLDPTDYPDGIAPDPAQIRDIRSPLSRAAMSRSPRISPHDLLDLKWSTRVHLADIVLDDLLTAAASEDLGEAVEVLRRWDRHAEAGSRGYLLFHLWAHDHFPVGDVVMDDSRLGTAREAGGLPTGLLNPAAAVDSLHRAAEALAQLGRPLDAAYGDVALIGAAPEDVPASGGPTYFGLFACLEIVPAPTDWPAIGGDTWISLIRFGGQGRAASSILLPGSATEPGAPAHRPQAPHFVEKVLVPHQPLA